MKRRATASAEKRRGPEDGRLDAETPFRIHEQARSTQAVAEQLTPTCCSGPLLHYRLDSLCGVLLDVSASLAVHQCLVAGPGGGNRDGRGPRDRLQALHGVLHPRRDRGADRPGGGPAGGPPAGTGQHGDSVRSPQGRQHRPVSGLHRHGGARAAEDRSHRPRLPEPRLAAARAGRRGEARFQQHLCAGAAGCEGARAGCEDHRRSGAASRAALRPVPRVPAAQRRLAGVAARLCPAAVAHAGSTTAWPTRRSRRARSTSWTSIPPTRRSPSTSWGC